MKLIVFVISIVLLLPCATAESVQIKEKWINGSIETTNSTLAYNLNLTDLSEFHNMSLTVKDSSGNIYFSEKVNRTDKTINWETNRTVPTGRYIAELKGYDIHGGYCPTMPEKVKGLIIFSGSSLVSSDYHHNGTGDNVVFWRSIYGHTGELFDIDIKQKYNAEFYFNGKYFNVSHKINETDKNLFNFNLSGDLDRVWDSYLTVNNTFYVHILTPGRLIEETPNFTYETAGEYLNYSVGAIGEVTQEYEVTVNKTVKRGNNQTINQTKINPGPNFGRVFAVMICVGLGLSAFIWYFKEDDFTYR